eukprot:GHVR01165288.1.p1 GENE.GHVR01165288.1~~GHVR01165288.1.p1  ORF type:complete len:129 (+),score=44.53 GHVR01165288.1:162-548(+)
MQLNTHTHTHRAFLSVFFFVHIFFCAFFFLCTHTHTQQFTHIGIRGFGADQVAHKAASLARQLHELELQVHALTCEVNELQENKMSPATPEGAVLVSLNRHQLSIKIMKHRADEIDARMEQLERSRGK